MFWRGFNSSIIQLPKNITSIFMINRRLRTRRKIFVDLLNATTNANTIILCFQTKEPRLADDGRNNSSRFPTEEFAHPWFPQAVSIFVAIPCHKSERDKQTNETRQSSKPTLWLSEFVNEVIKGRRSSDWQKSTILPI